MNVATPVNSEKLRYKIKVSGLPRFYSLLVSNFFFFYIPIIVIYSDKLHSTSIIILEQIF